MNPLYFLRHLWLTMILQYESVDSPSMDTRTGLLKTLVSGNYWLNLLTGGYLLTDGQILLLEC